MFAIPIHSPLARLLAEAFITLPSVRPTSSDVTNYTGSANPGSDNPDSGGSPEAAPVVEAEPVSKGILGTIINLMGGKKGKTPKQKKRKNAKRSLKKMKRKSRSSR